MSKAVQSLRGTKDLFNKDCQIHEYIIKTAKKIGELYGYEALSTPIIEYSSIYERSLGEESDVLSKEIYSFNDKSNDKIALRPEFTAGIIRAFLSNSLTHQLPLKLFSAGPVFRYDRPQAGRQRQFTQFNFEFIGADSAYHDAEVIKLAQDILQELKVEVSLEINSLGCKESKKNYDKMLFEYFSAYKNDLSEDSVKRLNKNPIRILDSKDEKDKKLLLHAPKIEQCYTNEAKDFFASVKYHLDLLGVKYIINPYLVRGLDYYRHTCFEFITSKIGAQGTVLGGGRYDGLVELMGGPKTPSLGFAAGIERLALIGKYELPSIRHIIILPLTIEDIAEAMVLASNLRAKSLPVIILDKGKVDKRLTKALKSEAQYVIFIGEEERKLQKYKLKNLYLKEEKLLSTEEIILLLNSNSIII